MIISPAGGLQLSTCPDVLPDDVKRDSNGADALPYAADAPLPPPFASSCATLRTPVLVDGAGRALSSHIHGTSAKRLNAAAANAAQTTTDVLRAMALLLPPTWNLENVAHIIPYSPIHRKHCGNFPLKSRHVEFGVF